ALSAAALVAFAPLVNLSFYLLVAIDAVDAVSIFAVSTFLLLFSMKSGESVKEVFVDGTTTMSTHERKARIREFYAVIYPSLLQLQKGVTDSEDKKQKVVCMERRTRSQSWPFCRDSLKRVNSCDLWVLTDSHQSMMNHMFLLLGLYELISAKEAMINGGAEIKGLIALFHQIFYQPDPKGGLKELSSSCHKIKELLNEQSSQYQISSQHQRLRVHHSIHTSQYSNFRVHHSFQSSSKYHSITVFRVHHSYSMNNNKFIIKFQLPGTRRLSLRARKEPSGFNAESSGDREWESGRQTATPTRVVTELTSRRSSLPCGRKIRREKENREEEDYPHSLSVAVHHIGILLEKLLVRTSEEEFFESNMMTNHPHSRPSVVQIHPSYDANPSMLLAAFSKQEFRRQHIPQGWPQKLNPKRYNTLSTST
ncbi:hypothetical protein S83_015431, partial [Arachis hypogaea]